MTKQFVELVRDMREAQTEYFSFRKSGKKQEADLKLIQCKDLERQVDRAIEGILNNPQVDMF